MKNFLLILALFPAVTFAVDTDALIAERTIIKIALVATEADLDSNRVDATINSQRVIHLAQSKEQIQKHVEEYEVRLNEFKTDWWAWDANALAVQSACETAVMINAGAPLTQAQKDQCGWSQLASIKVRQAELQNERHFIDLRKGYIQSLMNEHGQDTRTLNIVTSDLNTSNAELSDLHAKMTQRLAEINSILDSKD